MKIRNILLITVNFLVLFIIATTVFCMAVGAQVSEKQLLSPFVTFLAALLMSLACILYLSKRRHGLKEYACEQVRVKKYLAVAFLLMSYIGVNVYYKSGSDPWTIDYAARVIAGECPFEAYAGWLEYYYGIYPNNILFTVFYSLVLKINLAFGFLVKDHSVLIFVIINCLISTVSVYLIYLILRQITNATVATIGIVLSVIYFCFNPYNTWIYSDPFALWIPISIVAVVILFKEICWKWFAVGLLSVLAYCIKPQGIIPVIAIVFTWIIYAEKIPMLSFHKIMRLFCHTLLGVAISASIVLGSRAFFETKIPVDDNQAFPITHWMMMGLNQNSTGGWNGEDVNYTSTFDNKKLAKSGTVSVIKERLQEMGLPGYLNFLWRKLKRLCCDGTMNFGTSTGDWFDVVFSPKNSVSAPLFRSIYYNNGAYFGYLYTGLNLLWYFIMISCLLAAAININRPDLVSTWLGISILGVFLFELLFEAQARHLYSSLPIFVVYGCLGYFKILEIS